MSKGDSQRPEIESSRDMWNSRKLEEISKEKVSLVEVSFVIDYWV